MTNFKKIATFRVTAYHNDTLSQFLKILSLFCKKSRIFLQCKTKKTNEKKYTILRSPHVNKKSRDQIKTKKVVYTFFTKGGKQNWLYFLLTLKARSTSTLHFDYQNNHKQDLLLFGNILNETNVESFSKIKADRFNNYIESFYEL
jgi:hypothetical protein